MLSVSTTDILIGPDLKCLTTFCARLKADRVEQFYKWTELFRKNAAKVNNLMPINVTSDKAGIKLFPSTPSTFRFKILYFLVIYQRL
jgi:hypothetical protein